MDINAMTKALFPVVSVNTDGTIDPMEKPGTRYLIARNGIWLETTRPWLRAVVPHLTESFPVTPFGEIAARILETPPMNPEIMREFISSARKAAPAETGCWVFWMRKREISAWSNMNRHAPQTGLITDGQSRWKMNISYGISTLMEMTTLSFQT